MDRAGVAARVDGWNCWSSSSCGWMELEQQQRWMEQQQQQGWMELEQQQQGWMELE
eukprot:jgi/Pico_ML_1/52285/g3012.t1